MTGVGQVAGCTHKQVVGVSAVDKEVHTEVYTSTRERRCFPECFFSPGDCQQGVKLHNLFLPGIEIHKSRHRKKSKAANSDRVVIQARDQNELPLDQPQGQLRFSHAPENLGVSPARHVWCRAARVYGALQPQYATADAGLLVRAAGGDPERVCE